MSLILDGTSGLSDVDGTAATPAIRGTDTNTGIFFPAADTIAFSEGGVESMRIDASGNVGIGTASPTRRLQLSASGTACGIRIDNTVSGRPMLLAYDDSQNLTLTNSSDTGYFAYVNGTGAGTERMRIAGDGAISAGSTTGTVGLGVFSNFGSRILDFARYADDGATVGFRRGATVVGNISVTGSATAYNTSSDYRLKENIAPMAGALGLVQQLKPVTYNWKVDGSSGQGFIAHELAEVVPQAVTGVKDALDKDGNPEYQGIDVSFLVSTLTAAIQEQQALITQLQADVAALKVQP